MGKKEESIDEVIKRLLAQPEPVPLLEQEIKNVDQQILTTEQHMKGIESLKKTYEDASDTEAIDVVVKQLAENKQKLSDLSAQKEQLRAALNKLKTGDKSGGKGEHKTAKVLFDYEGKTKTELTVSAGDIVTILNTDNPEWWEAELNGKIGFFPMNYCELIKDSGSSGSKVTKSSDKDRRADVQFDYEARTESELTLKQGTTVKILSTSDEEWWQGERDDGQVGYFPAAFVKLRSGSSRPRDSGRDKSEKKTTLRRKKEREEREANEEKSKKKRKKKARPQAKVKHDYEADGDNELSIKQGWIVDIISKTNDDWWEGRYKGKIGFFPRNYVELIDEKKESSGGETARVLFDYTASGGTELSIATGQLVKIIDKTNDDWWEGEYDGKSGFFPKSYVELVGADETSDAARQAKKDAFDANDNKKKKARDSASGSDDDKAAAKKKQEADEAAAKKKKEEEDEAATKKKKEEEEAAAKKKEEDEAAAKKKKEEEEAAKKKKEEAEAAAAAAKKKKEEEEAAAKKAKEAADKKKKDEEEAAAKKKKEEADKKQTAVKSQDKKKKDEEEAAQKKKKQEEEQAAKKKKEEEEAAKKAKEAADKKKKADEAAAKKKKDEADKKKKEEDEAKAKAKAAADKKKADDDAARKKKEEADKKRTSGAANQAKPAAAVGAKKPAAPGRRPLPTPTAAPPVKGYFAASTIRLEARLKSAVREFVSDTVMERMQELEDRNAELEEELRYLRSKMLGDGKAVSGRASTHSLARHPKRPSSLPPSASPDTEDLPHRVRSQIVNFKSSLDDVERSLDALPASRTSDNLSNAEKKNVHELSVTVNRIRRQQPSLLKFAKECLELDRRNVSDIDTHMDKHIDRVFQRLIKLNPLIDTEQFKQREDYTEKRMFWETVERKGQEDSFNY